MSINERREPLQQCAFCTEEGRWPNIFWAPPYWCHEKCLVRVVEAGKKVLYIPLEEV